MCLNELKQLKTQVTMGQVQHIVFDLDGTLYSSRAGIEHQIPKMMVKCAADILNISFEDSRKLLLKYKTEFRSSVIGLRKYHSIDPEAYYCNVYDSLDISGLIVNDDLPELIREISEKMEVHLLTNSNCTHAKRILTKIGILEYFKSINSVENADYIRKPNVEAYFTLLKNIRAQPSKVVTIDDSFLNLRTAHKLGLHTILVSNGIASPPLFWEMHKKVFHPAPEFVNASYFSITQALIDICN